MTLKIVNNSDPGDADHVGGNDWDQLVALINSTGPKPYSYVVSKEGSTYIAKDDGWNVDSSNSTAETVIQYAIDNVTAGGTIAFKHNPNDWFVLTDGINLVDKKVRLVGLNDQYTTTAASGSNAWGGTVFKKNYAVAEPLFNMQNTSYNINSLSNMRIVGNSTSGDIGVKFYFGRKNILNNVSVTGFDVGIEAHAWVDCDIYSLRISNCLSKGLYCPAVSARINTTRFFGGSMSSNPTNLYFDASTANDVQFFGTQFEGANSGHVYAVQIENGANDVLFSGCSFEKNSETNPVCVYDSGNNNTYFKCRFDSDVSYTPINFRSTAKNNVVNNCFFQTNTAATTQTVLIDSGALDISLTDNKKSVNTAGTVALTDNGTRTRLSGNAQLGTGWDDKIPTPMLINDYTQDKVVSAPSDPASGFTRKYAKAVDANNDGWFVKRKLAGTVVEWRVA